ncbi:hypothetical protein BD779DRAFT_1473590 [Infundibulicybe gibba]|nr:hypothetical protein BD779DRAFT_1473590 [Infundibulicybe gibba]
MSVKFRFVSRSDHVSRTGENTVTGNSARGAKSNDKSSSARCVRLLYRSKSSIKWCVRASNDAFEKQICTQPRKTQLDFTAEEWERWVNRAESSCIMQSVSAPRAPGKENNGNELLRVLASPEGVSSRLKEEGRGMNPSAAECPGCRHAIRADMAKFVIVMMFAQAAGSCGGAGTGAFFGLAPPSTCSSRAAFLPRGVQVSRYKHGGGGLTFPILEARITPSKSNPHSRLLGFAAPANPPCKALHVACINILPAMKVAG